MAARGGRDGRGGRGRGPALAPTPAYDEILFRSARVAERWESTGIFRDREVEPGRVVAVEQLAPFFDVGAIFGPVGWDGILHISTPTCPAMVRYFFANLQHFPEEQMGEGEAPRFIITSRVRGVDVQIAEELLSEVFGLAMDGACLYWEPMGETAVSLAEMEAIRHRHVRVRSVPYVRRKVYIFSKSDLRDLPRVVCRILQHNVLPQAHHRDEVSSFRLFVIDALVRGVRLSLPHIIMRTMIHTFESGRAVALPYRKLLTHLLQHVFQVAVDGSEWRVEERRQGTPITLTTLRKMPRMTPSGIVGRVTGRIGPTDPSLNPAISIQG